MTGAPSMPESSPNILIADDQSDVLAALRLLLKGEGFRMESAASPAEILAASRGLAGAMPGIEMETLADHERLANRGW